jgi:hypothetical protein
LVQDRGGAEFQTGGILLYVEDLKLGTNKDIGPKDIFEMGSNLLKHFDPQIFKHVIGSLIFQHGCHLDLGFYRFRLF